jgi:hypothetical protein
MPEQFIVIAATVTTAVVAYVAFNTPWWDTVEQLPGLVKLILSIYVGYVSAVPLVIMGRLGEVVKITAELFESMERAATDILQSLDESGVRLNTAPLQMIPNETDDPR